MVGERYLAEGGDRVLGHIILREVQVSQLMTTHTRTYQAL
jgi:hypothetical protein